MQDNDHVPAAKYRSAGKIGDVLQMDAKLLDNEFLLTDHFVHHETDVFTRVLENDDRELSILGITARQEKDVVEIHKRYRSIQNLDGLPAFDGFDI